MSKIVNVKSSSIKTIEHDEVRKDLKVKFKSGNTYVYTPVTSDFFNKLSNSTSIGRYFYKNIRNNEAITCLKLIK